MVICASVENVEWDFTQGESGMIDVYINSIEDINFDPNTIKAEMPKRREDCYDFVIKGGPNGRFFSAWVYMDVDDIDENNLAYSFEYCFNKIAADEDPGICVYVRRNK